MTGTGSGAGTGSVPGRRGAPTEEELAAVLGALRASPPSARGARPPAGPAAGSGPAGAVAGPVAAALLAWRLRRAAALRRPRS